MNWTDVFPLLHDEMVDEYEAKATRKERTELADWFAVEEVINPRDVSHIVSVSLFWKNIRSHQPDIVIKNRAMFMGVGRRRKLLRFDPWQHYAEPLIKGALWVQANRPDVAYRVYLAADLEFLVQDLVIAGCEVYLMKSSSIRHNPGAMWRFLAFEETDKLVTVVDADQAAYPLPDIIRTETTAKAELGFWRVPVWGELNDMGNLNYRPIVGCQMGCTKPLPARLLMEALIWQTRRDGISKLANPPGSLPVTVHGTVWPDYGFDEWFLQAALYPRAAFEGADLHPGQREIPTASAGYRIHDVGESGFGNPVFRIKWLRLLRTGIPQRNLQTWKTAEPVPCPADQRGLGAGREPPASQG